MHAGIVHRYPDGSWQLGDVVLRPGQQIPRHISLHRQRFFFTNGLKDGKHWAEILGPRDEFFGSAPGNVMGVRIHLPNPDEDQADGHFTIMSPSVWSIPKAESNTPSTLDIALIRKYARYAHAGVGSIGSSIASTAMNWYNRVYNGREVDGVEYPELRQLAPRWRNLAHASFHGGPIACLRGGSKYAFEVDIAGAYLNALTKPVPVVDSQNQYLYHHNINWRQLRIHEGFAECTVIVPERYKAGLPPLPITTPICIQYPVGLFRGCWTIAQLREAEELYDVKIVHIHQHAIATRMEPLFAHLARTWSQMEDRAVAKSLYTRFWGKFGFRGGYQGRISDTPLRDHVPMNYLWWTDDRTDQTDTSDPFYRPDIAATIASYNHMAVQKALRMLKPESVVAVHVDAIWTDDEEGVERILNEIETEPTTLSGHWSLKREGKLRFWAAGVYDHNGKLGFSGYNSEVLGRPTHNRIDKWMRNSIEKTAVSRSRRWLGQSAALDSEARSEAVQLNQNYTKPTTEGHLVQSPIFNQIGWLR